MSKAPEEVKIPREWPTGGVPERPKPLDETRTPQQWAAWADQLKHQVEQRDATWRFDLTRNELLYLLSNERRAPAGQMVEAIQVRGGKIRGYNPGYEGPLDGVFYAPQCVDVPPKDVEL